MKSTLIFAILVIPFMACAQSLEKNQTNSDHNLAQNIIPKPVSVEMYNGKGVIVNNQTVIYFDPAFLAQADYLKKQIYAQCSLQLTIKTEESREKNLSGIILEVDSIAISKPEMYKLFVRNKQIKIQARDVRGFVNGIQTLMQLLPLSKITSFSVSPIRIEDSPRFAYRGMHLDVSRHFFPAEFIKKYIDYLTFHKFNTFHWHLTDDQGWRIEIKAYPKLTEVGAWRDSTLIGYFKDVPHKFDGLKHWGYYTQDEVKDIIKYASVRGITIIPEIDIPGHSRAAIASYPEFSTQPDTTWQVATKWGTFNRENNVLAPTTSTFEFLTKMFNEVADLFPSPYIHVGGDECSKIWWKADPKSQAFIKTHGLKDEAGLQAYFIQHVIKTLKEKGKKVIGWEEIIEGELDTSAIIMNWDHAEAGIKAATRKHDVIMTPTKPLYFNFYQSKDKTDSLSYPSYIPMEAVYNYEPIPKEFSQLGLGSRVLGAQGNMWTEYVDNSSKVEYMIFPRMTALSEVLWTESGKKDYTDFVRRLILGAIPRYQFWGSSYFKNFEQWTTISK